MNSFDVPDATDWASTTLSGFVAVESPMRCQVCKEFIKTPMITSCGHTFCSECIRRSLSHNGLCPACRTPDQELKLRANKSMEEVVEAFQRTREAALEVARAKPTVIETSPKRKRPQIESREETEEPNKKTRTSARISSRPTLQSTQIDGGNDVDLTVESDKEYIPDDGLVKCIMDGCDERMKEADVSKHLDDVHFNPAPKQSSRMSNFTTQSPAPRQNSSKPQPEFHPKPLPTLSYNLLKDKALRDKLHSLGIPSHGNRPLLERRHREWMTLWNANCDATHPKSKKELLKQLDEWERTQAYPTVHRGPKESQVANKEFDGEQWASQHSGEFGSLVEKARRQVRERKERERKAAEEVDKRPTGEDLMEVIVFEETPSHIEDEEEKANTRYALAREMYGSGNMDEQAQREKVSAEPQSINGVSADSSSIPTDQGAHPGAEQEEWWMKELVAGAAAPANSQSQNNGFSEARGAQQHPYQQSADHQWTESGGNLQEDPNFSDQFRGPKPVARLTGAVNTNTIDPALNGQSEFDFDAFMAQTQKQQDAARLHEAEAAYRVQWQPNVAAFPPASQPPQSSQPQYQQQRHQQSPSHPPAQPTHQQYPPNPSYNIQPVPILNFPSPGYQEHQYPPSGQPNQLQNDTASDDQLQRMLQHGDMRNRDGSQMTAQQRLEILKRPYRRTGSEST